MLIAVSASEPGAYMVDVRMIGGLKTIGVSPTDTCSAILEKLNIDPGEFHILCGTKPLNCTHCISDYDFPARFSVEVLPILHGRGTCLFCFCRLILFLDLNRSKSV